ncbi:hypothetical protein NADFUDRAFT_53121 [Nadsonia fulvescens var. elongata DSM 6958]|uniref:ER membrane protein complex subunit 7 beta-sandwich domain-containing protein n=1 Tax=Nadsonia fulvescens var. elongata DSM 6958 TaxID=857566 RepID=A0A1E3PDT4_9ASCO|nr:hypothetical protein NADFUDRAFT_53121 [Nadsonia fulvescens var. elongata DSM 6958]
MLKNIARSIVTLLLLLIGSVNLTSGYTLRGTLPSNLQLSPKLIESTYFTLESNNTAIADKKAFIQRNRDFAFHNVSVGSYVVNLHSINLQQLSYRINIEEDSVKVYDYIAGNGWESLGHRVPYPIEIPATPLINYEVPRETFSLIEMIKNPMILMSLASLVMVFALPNILNNLDPETVQALQAKQARAGNNDVNHIQKKINDFDMAEFLAKKTSRS